MLDQTFDRIKEIEGALSSSHVQQIKRRCNSVPQYLQQLEIAYAASNRAIALLLQNRRS